VHQKFKVFFFKDRPHSLVNHPKQTKSLKTLRHPKYEIHIKIIKYMLIPLLCLFRREWDFTILRLKLKSFYINSLNKTCQNWMKLYTSVYAKIAQFFCTRQIYLSNLHFFFFFGKRQVSLSKLNNVLHKASVYLTKLKLSNNRKLKSSLRTPLPKKTNTKNLEPLECMLPPHLIGWEGFLSLIMLVTIFWPRLIP
jgi:hypothetical protein